MVAKGSIVKFGKYYQTIGKNKEDIEWIVLDEKEDRALLICKYVLDAKAYNEQLVDITWEKCTLRKWLNTAFIKDAFSEYDQQNIISVTIKNHDNSSPLRMKVPVWLQQYNQYGSTVSGGNDTTDRVFILSWEEAIEYFPKHPESDKMIFLAKACVAMFDPQDMTVVARALAGIKVDGTEYAKSHNLDISDGIATIWFRSPGNTSQMAVVTMAGDILYRPGCEVDDATNGVRPALWVSKKAFLTSEKIKDFKRQGLCQYCGGKINGLIIKKCCICGKKKDY